MKNPDVTVEDVRLGKRGVWLAYLVLLPLGLALVGLAVHVKLYPLGVVAAGISLWALHAGRILQAWLKANS